MHKDFDSVVIAAAKRTPIGSFQGDLSTTAATKLGAISVSAVIESAGLNHDMVDELLFGCVLPAGLGQAPARQVALAANLSHATKCTTVNKVCGSGLQSVLLAHDVIKAGSSDIVIAGGMENMSLAPHLLPKMRAGLRMGHGDVVDHVFLDGLEDAYTGSSMGLFAQATADKYKLTRECMDDFAQMSLRRAQTAIEQGFFASEITPVIVKSRNGEENITQDQQPSMVQLEKIPQLKPAFAKNGTITAANASSLSDGAAALLLMKASRANDLGLQPLAKISAHASFALEPQSFTLAPVDAIKRVIEKTGWQADEVDLYEINEAFAMVTLLASRALNIDLQKINVHGGACALGHPIGASGARILVTLIHALQRLDKTKGIASLCIGGGEAVAIAIELL